MEPEKQQSTEPANGQQVVENTQQENNPTESPLPSASTDRPVISKSGRFGGKKLGIIVGLVLLLLIAAGAVWYFALRDKDTSSQANQDTDQSQGGQTEEQLLTEPDVIAYAHRDSTDVPYKLYTRPATTEGERTEVMVLPEGVYVSQSAAKGRQVAFATEIVAGSTEKASIYYSSNAGASYQKIYTDDSEADAGNLGTQVTSMVFSTDGKALAAALLPPGGNNQVTEISLEGSYDKKVLFTADQRGVFLEGYDQTSQQALYAKGCYNCGGVSDKLLYVRNLTSGVEEVLYESEGGSLSVAVDKDFEKVLVSEGTVGPELELGGQSTVAPYELFMVNIATKEKTPITEVADETYGIGFMQSGRPYVVTANKVMEAGGSTVPYETSSTLQGAYFVTEDSVVARVGSALDEFTLNYFKVGSEAPISILNGDGNTVIFGVALK